MGLSCCGGVSLPTIIRQIIQGHLLSAGVLTVTPDLKRLSYDRLNVCFACPMITPGAQCKRCGCGLAEKTLVRDAKCPENKW